MCRQTLLLENCLNGRLRQNLVKNRILAIHDLLWRAGQGKDPEPQINIETGHAQFNKRRNLLRLPRPHFAANCENEYLPALR